MAFNTPFGMYKFNRMPFGITIAPEFFQKVNSQNFADIPGVVIYFDDILIASDTLEEHDKILQAVIERAKKLNIRFNKEKIQFKQNHVKYLGHIFSQDGISADEDRIKSITDLKNPKNKKDLQKILGMINYLRKFIPNLSEKTVLLRELLKIYFSGYLSIL